MSIPHCLQLYQVQEYINIIQYIILISWLYKLKIWMYKLIIWVYKLLTGYSGQEENCIHFIFLTIIDILQ